MVQTVKKYLVCGAGGFIGSHVAKVLKEQGHFVIGVDIKAPEFSATACDEFYKQDLTHFDLTLRLFNHYQFDEVFQFAADMGGAGYINTGNHDDQVVWNSMMINLNVLKCCVFTDVKKVFYASSACVYAEHDQMEEFNPGLKEPSAYPANPDSEYGWEKLFSERVYNIFQQKNRLEVRTARFHNVFGEEGTWDGGKEKVPAAMCRKVAMAAANGGVVEIWGDGKQTRSFLHIDEAVEAILRLMESDYSLPLNIGSDFLISINDLCDMIAGFEGQSLVKKHIPGPQGVRGRNSNNDLIKETLDWSPTKPLSYGMERTYFWIKQRVAAKYGH